MKKFLSLVLALVMTMSLVTVSAGAKDFADDGEITYKEAVDVISALGIVDGYSDDSFRPDGVLTRGAAAKIICNLILGPTTAEALSAGTAPFKDVPVTNTFAGYITYCSQQGIISGYADGTFRPTGTLSGNAFMKMLLGALGYDSSIEGYTGANWTVNVIKQAVGIGLDDGNDNFVGSQAVTREEAALYAFNMLNATMVEYDQQNTIVVGDITINTTSSRKDVSNTTDTDGNIGSRDRKMQFAERYFGDLSEHDGDSDAFERPSTTWKLKSKTIGTYADEPDVSYTAATRIGDIYTDLGLDDGISKSDVTMYVDGVDAGSFGYDVVRGERQKIGGDGALLDVYYDDDADTLTLVQVNTYVGKVNTVYGETSTKDAYIVLKASAGDRFTGPGDGDDFETEDFDKDDIVYYTFSKKAGENCIQSMGLAESVSGAMSTYTTTGSVTVAGNKYDSNNSSATYIKEFVTSVDKGSDVTVYLDPYGYVLYVDADVEARYAVVLDYTTQAGDFNRTTKAELLFTDGTTDVVEVELGNVIKADKSNPALSASGTFSSNADGKLNKYDIVSYSVDSDEVYTLNLVADSKLTDVGANTDIVTNGKNSINLRTSDAVNIHGDSVASDRVDGKTIFLVADTSKVPTGGKATYSVYEGFANVPTIATKASGTYGFVGAYAEDGASTPATVVFIERTNDMTISSGSSDMLYIKGVSSHNGYPTYNGQSYTTELGYFYEYDAFLNGEEVTVKTETYYTVDTLVYGPRYNTKGIMTGGDAYVSSSHPSDTDMTYTTKTDSVTNDVIKLGNTYYAYTSGVNVYYITVDGDLIERDITEIGYDTNDMVFLKVNDRGLLTDVYVKVYDAPETVNPGAGVLSATALTKDGSGDLVASVTLTGPAAGDMTFNVTVERYMEATNIWQSAATGTVTVANGNSAGQSAALIAGGSLVSGALYRVTATYNGGSVTSGNFTA